MSRYVFEKFTSILILSSLMFAGSAFAQTYAVLLEYTGNAMADGSYIVAQAELSDSAEGLYCQDGGGLLNFELSVFNLSGTLLFNMTDADDQFPSNNFLHIDADGAVDEWWLLSRAVFPDPAFTVEMGAGTSRSTGQYIGVGNCDVSNGPEPIEEDIWYAPSGNPDEPIYSQRLLDSPGVWTSVTDPEILLELLDTAVTGVGPGSSLADKIELAQTYLAVSDVQSTCAMLRAFLNQVRAQRGKKLTVELADQLTADAQAIQAAIGCD